MSQPNEITLAVDVANDATLVDKDYRLYERGTGRSTYFADATHSLVSRDQLQFYRTAEKRNGESRGSAKCAFKFTQDREVDNVSGTGTITLPQIAEVSFSIPVGTTSAQMLEMRQQIIALLDDDTVMDTFNGVLEI